MGEENVPKKCQNQFHYEKKCSTVFLFPEKVEIQICYLTAAMGRFVILSTYFALSCLQEIN